MRIHIGKLFSQNVQLNVLMIGFTTMVVGCGGLQLDEHVTKYGRPLSDPTSPPASITLEPVQTTNPINTPQTLKAIVKDAKGKRVYSAMVEWILARANGAVGDIVEVQQDPLNRALKMDNAFALAGANRRGESFISVTSVQEGTTHVIAVVPDIQDKTKNRAFGVLHWLDAEWDFPKTQSQQIGTSGTLTTTVRKASTGEPLPGYQVTWNITSGPPAHFEETHQTEAITETDENGVAQVTLAQDNPGPGGNAVHIGVIKPSEPGRPCCPAVSGLIAQDTTAVEWVSPSLGINQNCPSAIVVGEPAPFRFTVTNTSDELEARNVKVTSSLPDGLTYIQSTPPAQQLGNVLMWTLGNISPHDTQEVRLELQPTRPGNLTHKLSVETSGGYRTTSLCSTNAGEAKLTITQRCPADGIVGDTLRFTTTVENTGSGEAKNVEIVSVVPVGFRHASEQREIRRVLPTLPAGSSHTATFEFVGGQPGTAISTAKVTAHNQQEEAQCEVTLRESSITITKTGPANRFLNRPVTYEIVISNPGNAPATGVVINDSLPSGVQYTTSSPSGTFNPTTNGLSWEVGSVAPGETKTFTVTGRAITVGRHCNAAIVKTSRQLRESAQVCTEVKGIGALLIVVTDAEDPVEVGETEQYSIVVTNQGTAPITNIKISAELSDKMKYVSSTGSSSRLVVLGKRVDFDPIPAIAPKKSITFTVTVRGTQPGDERFRVRMEADQLTSPVLVEESTNFYQ
ncbi:MAG: hypothetical protein O7F12_02170 [Nitrospirae bacterium]|nr:hypothetical protein [Nitrospirota bacterium]